MKPADTAEKIDVLEFHEINIMTSPARKSMLKNRAKNTLPEVKLRQGLRAAGLPGYRLFLRLPGKPDVTYVRRRVAIFVHGCFWHRCPVCQLRRNLRPTANAEYWSAKFAKNVERDKRNDAALEAMGFQVVVIWECEIRSDIAACVERVREALDASS